jgi:hypothetical protein
VSRTVQEVQDCSTWYQQIGIVEAIVFAGDACRKIAVGRNEEADDGGGASSDQIYAAATGPGMIASRQHKIVLNQVISEFRDRMYQFKCIT